MKQNIKNNITELVFILDKSGSMTGLESDTVGGFNAMIKRQKEAEGECFVTTVLFNENSTVLHDRIKLCDVPEMTENEYWVSGCTALYDAIGKTVHHIASIHKYARPEDVPAHTMFVITTDGMENASKDYSEAQVKELIEKERTKYGWEFIFIGANIDAEKTARQMGISKERAVNYNADKKGTEVLYESVSDAVCCARACMPLSDSWRAKIDEDFKKRGKKNN